MRCDVCHRDDVTVVIVPIVYSGIHFFCLECIGNLRMFCRVHRRVHEAFYDGTHACPECVVDDATEFGDLAPDYVDGLRDNLPREEFIRLWAEAMAVSTLTGTSLEYSAFCYMVLAGKRFNLSLDAVFDQIVQEQNVGMILLEGPEGG